MNRIDEKIINLLNNKSIKNEDVLEYVKEKFKTSQLGNTTLGYLFEAYVGVVGWEDESKFISPDISMTELLAINDYFKTTNGCQWARTDQNYLGRKYNIIRTRSKGKVYSIKLNGLNDRPQRFRGIRKDIVSKIKNQNCVILDIGTNIEVDHKNGRYNDKNVSNIKKQQLNDFQPLCKTANDAKRHHCKICISNNKRYDAKKLGYKKGWTIGNENSQNCIGCYWYDPPEFNKTISKKF